MEEYVAAHPVNLFTTRSYSVINIPAQNARRRASGWCHTASGQRRPRGRRGKPSGPSFSLLPNIGLPVVPHHQQSRGGRTVKNKVIDPQRQTKETAFSIPRKQGSRSPKKNDFCITPPRGLPNSAKSSA